MTFETLVETVAERTNQTSLTAKERIGRNVNEIHRAITSSLGLETTRNAEVTGLTVLGSDKVTFGDETTGVTKLLTVLHPDTGLPLSWVNPAELRMQTPRDWPPRAFALYRTNSFSVEIKFDAEADADDEVITADAMVRASVLHQDDEPSFTEDYHDILVQGALGIELRILKDIVAARDAELQYARRMSELRMHYATNSWQDIHQGKTGKHGRSFSL